MLYKALRLFSAICIVYYLIAGFTLDFICFSVIAILLSNVYLIYRVRNNVYYTIIMAIILYSNYSILYANFINPIDIMYTDVIKHNVTILSVNILTFFNVALLLVFPRNINSRKLKIPKHRGNKLVYYCICAVLIFIFFHEFRMPEEVGGRGGGTPLLEYSLIFFMYAYYYAGNNSKQIKFIVFLVIVFVLREFLFGGRVSALQFLFVTYLMVYIDKFSLKKLSIIVAPIFFLCIIIGVVRGNLMSGKFSVDDIFFDLIKNGMAIDTAYSSYYTSETFIYSYNMDINTRLGHFQDFIISIFMGEGYNPDARLGAISLKYIYHNWGGILPFFFYFYLERIGLVCCMLLIMFYIRLVNRKKISRCAYFVATFFIANAFRWYLYTPIVLLRGVMFVVLLYWGLYLFDKLTERKRKVNVKKYDTIS